jgi:hypothetical protein
MMPKITKPHLDPTLPVVSLQKARVPSNGHSQGPSHEQIAQCAYDIYVAHGRVDGRSEQDWRQAEEELAQSAKAADPKAVAEPRA